MAIEWGSQQRNQAIELHRMKMAESTLMEEIKAQRFEITNLTYIPGEDRPDWMRVWIPVDGGMELYINYGSQGAHLTKESGFYYFWDSQEPGFLSRENKIKLAEYLAKASSGFVGNRYGCSPDNFALAFDIQAIYLPSRPAFRRYGVLDLSNGWADLTKSTMGTDVIVESEWRKSVTPGDEVVVTVYHYDSDDYHAGEVVNLYAFRARQSGEMIIGDKGRGFVESGLVDSDVIAVRISRDDLGKIYSVRYKDYSNRDGYPLTIATADNKVVCVSSKKKAYDFLKQWLPVALVGGVDDY
jgi:hypothetical protein